MDIKKIEEFFTLAARLAGLTISRMGFEWMVIDHERFKKVFIVHIFRKATPEGGITCNVALSRDEIDGPNPLALAEARWCAAVDETWKLAAKA